MIVRIGWKCKKERTRNRWTDEVNEEWKWKEVIDRLWPETGRIGGGIIGSQGPQRTVVHDDDDVDDEVYDDDDDGGGVGGRGGEDDADGEEQYWNWAIQTRKIKYLLKSNWE